MGYEITRFYLDGKSEIAFDKLHYYPDTGFVYYDGIVNGSSEYDGKWYTAQPEIKRTFETALFTQIRLLALGTEDGAKAIVPPPQNQARTPVAQPRTTVRIIVTWVIPVLVVATFAFLRSRRFLPR